MFMHQRISTEQKQIKRGIKRRNGRYNISWLYWVNFIIYTDSQYYLENSACKLISAAYALGPNLGILPVGNLIHYVGTPLTRIGRPVSSRYLQTSWWQIGQGINNNDAASTVVMVPYWLYYAVSLLPDTQNCGLRMRWECREHFPAIEFKGNR